MEWLQFSQNYMYFCEEKQLFRKEQIWDSKDEFGSTGRISINQCYNPLHLHMEQFCCDVVTYRILHQPLQRLLNHGR